jgi:hypothetical protein
VRVRCVRERFRPPSPAAGIGFAGYCRGGGHEQGHDGLWEGQCPIYKLPGQMGHYRLGIVVGDVVGARVHWARHCWRRLTSEVWDLCSCEVALIEQIGEIFEGVRVKVGDFEGRL